VTTATWRKSEVVRETVELLTGRGTRAWAPPVSFRHRTGAPDILVVSFSCAVFIEVIRPRGSVTRSRRRQIKRLEESGARVALICRAEQAAGLCIANPMDLCARCLRWILQEEEEDIGVYTGLCDRCDLLSPEEDEWWTVPDVGESS
jgi:hypothetical protein